MSIIIDAHEDLAYSALTFGRDYTRPAHETRRLEAGTLTPERNNGDAVIGWPDYQRGQVALVFGTMFLTPHRYASDWESQQFRDFDEARRLYHGQIEYYQRLCGDHPDKFCPVRTQKDLQNVLKAWQEPASENNTHPVGLLLLLEGAEGVGDPKELEEYWEAGLRIVGPVWAGTRYCGGMHEPGPITRDGRQLLEVMANLGLTLDLAHMTELSALMALDKYPGRIIATHANSRALLNSKRTNFNSPTRSRSANSSTLLNPELQERHLTDATLHRLIERDGIVGVMPCNSFLNPNWKHSDPQEQVPLEMLVEHIDYICQMAGDTRHVALGSDFDGGFGYPSVPYGIDTIADLQKLDPLLTSRGYNKEDIAAILGGNWQRLLEETLPA